MATISERSADIPSLVAMATSHLPVLYKSQANTPQIGHIIRMVQLGPNNHGFRLLTTDKDFRKYLGSQCYKIVMPAYKAALKNRKLLLVIFLKDGDTGLIANREIDVSTSSASLSIPGEENKTGIPDVDALIAEVLSA